MIANFSVHSSSNCRFSLSIFLLAVNVEHAVFVQPTAGKMSLCEHLDQELRCVLCEEIPDPAEVVESCSE